MTGPGDHGISRHVPGDLSMPAQISRRFLCTLIDVSLLVVIHCIIIYDTASPQWLPEYVHWLYGTKIEVMRITYFIVMHGLFGQTIGKMLGGIAVVTLDDAKISYRRSILRELASASGPTLLYVLFVRPFFPRESTASHAARSLLYLCWIFDYSMIFFDKERRQAFHDRIAGTKVIDNRNREALQVVS